MFKKFSSLLIIFAVAISLIVLSETESNAQCGGCGEPECDAEFPGDGDLLKGSYIPWFDIVRLTTPIPPGTSLFFLTSIEAVSGCIVCQDPETDDESLVSLPSREISTQIYSPSEDLQPVGDGLERLTVEACETAVEEVCGECDGKVSQLTLRYDGPFPGASITVYQHKDEEPIFGPTWVDNGTEFELNGTDKWKDTLGPKIQVNYSEENDWLPIHTSCSDPVGPGFVSGDFTVMSAYSRYGGLLCPIDGSLTGSECIVEDFEQEWGLSSADCQDHPGSMPSQILLQSNYLTGTILYCTNDENGNPYLDENGNPDDCSQGDEICLYCQTEEACETWNDDGNVIFDCVPCEDVGVGTEVTGTVTMAEVDEETYAWPVSTTTTSLDNIEFMNVKTNSTIFADFISNTLVLKYESTSGQSNITTPPLVFSFAFDSEIISAVNLQSSTFSQDIIMSYTSDSLILRVPMQNKNPGEIFTATYELIF
jgi:hypothetical protein